MPTSRPIRYSTCKVCEKEFMLTRDKREFCSVYCQQKHYRLQSREHSRLRQTLTLHYTTLPGENCAYCGSPVSDNNLDHFVPVSFVGLLKDDEIEKLKDNNKLLMLPCCQECNSLASDQVFKTIEEKREYIQSLLLKRYNHILNRDPCDERDDLNQKYIIARLSWENPNVESLNESFDNLLRRKMLPTIGKRACKMCHDLFLPQDTENFTELFCTDYCAREYTKKTHERSMSVFKKETC